MNKSQTSFLAGGDPYLAPFSSMTDGQLRDPKQLVGLARAIDPEGAPERLASGLFVAESVNVIDRALNAGCVPFAVLTDARWLAASEALLEKVHAANPAAPVAVVSSEEMRSITGYEVTRGPLAAFHRPPEPDLAALLADAHRVAVLEDVTNYTNIGAIFRCAAALGMDAVLLTAAGSDPLYRRASRVSMGNVFLIPWTYLPEEAPWPERLRRLGFQTVAMALREDSLLLNDPRLMAAEKLAVVLGTEGDGLSDGTIAACDYTVRIPMTHGVDSLNVAAASAVAFYQLGLMSGGAPT